MLSGLPCLQLDSLLAARESLNLSLAGSGGKLSVNDFIVKAAALACRKVPAVNASWKGDFIRWENMPRRIWQCMRSANTR
jgi:pyruvate dehydrogenase E2 component (dihydrolipoamide acetyltransferase)